MVNTGSASKDQSLEGLKKRKSSKEKIKKTKKVKIEKPLQEKEEQSQQVIDESSYPEKDNLGLDGDTKSNNDQFVFQKQDP